MNNGPMRKGRPAEPPMPAPGSDPRSGGVDLGEAFTPHAAPVTTLDNPKACLSGTIHDDHARVTPTDHADESPITINPHAHEHAHSHDFHRRQSGAFPHEKLDAYRIALDMARLAKRLASQIPRGQRNTADHLLRAASNAVLLLAEGANRRGDGEKRQRFVESRGECAEVAAAADLVMVLELGSQTEAQELKSLAARVSAMLTRLISRLRPA